MPDSSTPSQALGAGRKRFASPDTETCHAGQDRPHASHSASPGADSPRPTNDISRQSGSISSVSAALQASLESRLRTRLGTDGSTIYSMRWKTAATPAGRQYCQLVASVRRTSESGSFSERSGWKTPVVNESTHCYSGRNPEGSRKIALKLTGEALLTGWPTPTTRDHKDGQECPNVPTNSLLGREVWKADQPVRITADGQVLTGSDAGTVSSGQLNPAHSRWLMGYPPVWDDCAVTAMPSSRSVKRSS